MRVAIPYWTGRISPVFDVARNLILVDIEDSVEVSRDYKILHDEELAKRASRCKVLGINVLICGAISKFLVLALEARNIRIIAQVCGNLDEVLEAYMEGRLNHPSFKMPGCKLLQRDYLFNSIKRNQHRPKIRRNGMRIAITSKGPDLKSPIDPRFGRAKFLIVLDTETKQFNALDNSINLNAQHGAGISVAKKVADDSVDAVITGHIGPKASEALDISNIRVYLTPSGTVEEAVQQFESGKLRDCSRSTAVCT